MEKHFSNTYRCYLEHRQKLHPFLGIYRRYFALGRLKKDAVALANVLSEIGDESTAEFLRLIGQQDKESSVYTLTEGPWAGTKCYASPLLPDASLGELWFDTLSLQRFVLVPGAVVSNRKQWRWVATRPILVWQFIAFASMIRAFARDEFGLPEDYLALERWRSLDLCSAISACYHDEAIAYNHFRGFGTATAFDFECARELVPDEAFQEMLPKNFQLWSGSESHSEFLRDIFSQSTLGNETEEYAEDVLERLEKLGGIEALKHIPIAERILCSEWEKHTNIGASSSALHGFGLVDSLPRESWCAVLNGQLWR